MIRLGMMRRKISVFRIAALVSYVIGYLYVRFVLFGTAESAERFSPLWFSILLIGGVEIFSSAAGKRALHSSEGTLAGKNLPEAAFFAVCALVQSVAYAAHGLHGDTFAPTQILFWHFTLIYYILCRTGMQSAGRSGILFPLDAFAGLFYLPWLNIFLRIVSVFRRNSERSARNAGTTNASGAAGLSRDAGAGKLSDIAGAETAAMEEKRTENAATRKNVRSDHPRRQTVLTAVISALAALLICAYAWNELSGVTNSFAGIGISLSDFFHELLLGNFMQRILWDFLPYFLLSVPVSAWLFGLTGGGLLRKEPPLSQEEVRKETEGLHLLPSWSACLIFGALTAVYLLFFAVSVREIWGQILSVRLSVSDACLYAVSGFWQLVRVVTLNFLLIFFSCLFFRVPLWEEKRTRILITVQFICSLLFGFLAFWKLFAWYLGLFGATPRRALSSWMVLMLILWTVLALIRFYRKIPAARIGILAAAASFSALCLLPVG